MSVMPTPAELLYIVKNHHCDKNELIMIKTLLEMQMAYVDYPEQAPFKQQMKFLLPAQRLFYKKIDKSDFKSLYQQSLHIKN